VPALIRLWAESEERRERLCRAFYDDVYRDSFPEPDETEDPDIWLPLMRPDPPADKQRVFLIVATDADRVAGGIMFELYPRSGDWLVTYIAVRRDQRGTGLGTALFAEMLRAVGELAPKRDWQVYAECENPLCRPAAQRGNLYRRLAILSTFGLRHLPFDYVQPALSPDKNQLDDLLFLCWPRENADGDTAIEGERIASFMAEFYATLDQSDAPALARMTAQLTAMEAVEPELLDVPAKYDQTLGTAKSFVIRMTFFSHYLRDLGGDAAQSIDWGEVPLDLIRPPDSSIPAAGHHLYRLSDALLSFHGDIVIPFASASSLPIILQCEEFREDGHTTGAGCQPPDVRIAYPETLQTEWEGDEREVPFAGPGEGEWIVDAKFVDSVAVFESGYIAYSVAFVFGKSGGARPFLNAAAILALASIAKPAGRVAGVPLRLAFGTEAFKPAHIFLRDRLHKLHRLAVEKHRTVFSVILAAKDEETRDALCDGLLQMAFPDPAPGAAVANTRASISIEVIGAARHGLVMQMAEEAARRVAPVTAFTLRLAGIAQNVLDFHEQDAIEVHDSLAGSFALGQDITFAHKDLAIRFSRSSRAFEEMWAVAGGEPYWMLVELILGHNSKLLADLNDDLRKDQGERGLTKRMRQSMFLDNTLTSRESRDKATDELSRTQVRRIRLNFYIPNLFRYPTERQLYDMFADARGLRIQRQYFSEQEKTLERMLEETAQLKTAINEERRNNLLVAIGVAQATGVFAGFASVFAALATVDEDKHLGPFVKEVEREIGMPAIESVLPALPHDMHLPALSHDAWALIPTLGLIFGGFGFVGAVTLIFVLSRFGVRAGVAAVVVAVGFGVAIWVLADVTREPFLDVVVPICAVAVALPIVMYLLWRPRDRRQQPPRARQGGGTVGRIDRRPILRRIWMRFMGGA
jgi:GNAT superfamily N-acetyltransferase